MTGLKSSYGDSFVVLTLRNQKNACSMTWRVANMKSQLAERTQSILKCFTLYQAYPMLIVNLAQRWKTCTEERLQW